MAGLQPSDQRESEFAILQRARPGRNLLCGKLAVDPVVSETSAFESDMVLADLLSVTHKRDEAKTAYERLAQSNPGRPQIEESLGYLAWQSDDPESARRHFARAIEAGSKDPQMC